MTEFSSRVSPPLLLDGMLGRLARWLRLLGYDAAYDRQADDHELARRARAESRVLLTRDRELAARQGIQTLLIINENLEEQLRQVRQTLGSPPGAPFSRCPACNSSLVPASREAVRERVPPYVLRRQIEFRLCPGCRRAYWPGTHVERIQRIASTLAAIEPPP
jgi:uncharacterized protein with PIN domain